jgi:hypothetical protein
MLNLDHPMTENIFRASGLIGAIMDRAQKMPVVSGKVRAELLKECQPYFQELRALATIHFQEDIKYLLHWICEYEKNINTISSLIHESVPEFRHETDPRCSACRKEITLKNRYYSSSRRGTNSRLAPEKNNLFPRIINTANFSLVLCHTCDHKQRHAQEEMTIAQCKLSECFLVDDI